MKSKNEKTIVIEITEDDYGLILDALYEQAMAQEDNKNYNKALRKTAKKIEKAFKNK